MPQPLSRVPPAGATIQLCNAGARPLQHNPALGVLAMEAMIAWSNVEMFLLRTYVGMMGGIEEDSVSIYLAMNTKSEKTHAINAMALKKLSSDNAKLLQAIISYSKSIQKSRDKLAHWVWGISQQIPDGFLLCDPRIAVNFLNSDFDRSKILVFKERDFVELIESCDKICGFGLRLSFVLSNHVANRDGRIYDELCSQPELIERLGRPA